MELERQNAAPGRSFSVTSRNQLGRTHFFFGGASRVIRDKAGGWARRMDFVSLPRDRARSGGWDRGGGEGRVWKMIDGLGEGMGRGVGGGSLSGTPSGPNS